MLKEPDIKIVLEDGTEYIGYSFGSKREKVLEIVFNTSMVGYQEMISDPSYTDQAVVMTYPLIGNYGMNSDDYETKIPSIGALIVHDYNDEPSNFRSEETLGAVMNRYGITGISGIDTRKLNRSIRDWGSRKALLADSDVPLEECLKRLQNTVLPHDQVSRVSRRSIKVLPAINERYHVVAIDCGMKENIIRSMVKKGCKVSVVPWNETAKSIETLKPDGIFISNGPGDPTDVPETIQTVKALLGKYPVFGICLRHQILALAYGAKTYKLKFGHRGGNHPVKNLMTDKIEITSQNHSYAVDPDSIGETPLKITHINLLDETIEGISCEKDHAFSVQYHPESAPGPQDSAYLFDIFLKHMEESRNHA